MNIKTEKHLNDYDRDEDNYPGESSLSCNLLFDFQGVMPMQKVALRAYLDSCYKDLCEELKRISVQ
jgi:hypothetical protein